MNSNKTAADFFDVGATLDDINVRLHQAQNMLCIYDENIEDELKYIREHENIGTRYFVDRYDIYRSLLEVIQLYIVDASRDLKQSIEVIYEAHRAVTKVSC